MMYRGPQAFLKVVSELSKLPGVGEKTAQRLVFHLLYSEEKDLQALSSSIANLKTQIRFCSVCFGLTDQNPCPICDDSKRDQELICVVEDPTDLMAIERSGQFPGVYHVLHGSLSPLEGRGPDQLKVASLIKRLEDRAPREVILATNPDVEGEATALYLGKICADRKIMTSRIALGLPMGGHLEYADQLTVGRAITERRNFLSRA